MECVVECVGGCVWWDVWWSVCVGGAVVECVGGCVVRGCLVVVGCEVCGGATVHPTMMMTPMNRLVKMKWPRRRKEMVKNSLPWNPCKESWS